MAKPTNSNFAFPSLEETSFQGQSLIKKVENAIYRHPDVSDTVAVFMPDEISGETNLAAFIVPANVNLSVQEIKLFVEYSGLLSPEECPQRYHMVSEIPKTPSGKCQKYKLIERLTGI